jgi:hypothetical protein
MYEVQETHASPDARRFVRPLAERYIPIGFFLALLVVGLTMLLAYRAIDGLVTNATWAGRGATFIVTLPVQHSCP